MTDYYRDYDTVSSPRRGYNPTDYEPRRGSGYDDAPSSARERPYDTLYRRSFDPNIVEDNRLAPYQSRDGGRPRSVSRSRYYDDDGPLSPASEGAYRKRHHSARPRSRSRSRAASRDRDGSRDRGFVHGLEDDVEDGEKEIKGHFGKDRKDVAASVVGAVVGGWLGHEADKRKGHGMHNGVATLGGAVLGGLAGNAIEHRHLKKEQSRRRSRHQSESRRYSDSEEEDERYSGRY